MEVRNKLILLILIFFRSSAAYGGNCQIEDLYLLLPINLQPIINDTYIGNLNTWNTSNIVEISKIEGKYLGATLDSDGVLTVFTTEDFKHFEEDYGSSYENTIEATITFKCSDEKEDEVKFVQEVEDINNHDPTFNKQVYEYKLAMDVPEAFDFSELIPIIVTDIDFTNSEISFALESEGSSSLAISKRGFNKGYDKKTFYTTLKALKPLTVPFSEELVLVATDGGEPSRSTNVTLRINLNKLADKEEVAPSVIKFSKTLYYANYTKNESLILQENMKILGNTDLQKITLTQTGYTNNFVSTLDQSSQEIKMNVAKNLESDILQNDFLIVELNAKFENSVTSDHATVLVYLPNQDASKENNNKPQNNSTSVIYFCDDYTVSTPVTIFFFVLLIIVISNVVLLMKFLKR